VQCGPNLMEFFQDWIQQSANSVIASRVDTCARKKNDCRGTKRAVCAKFATALCSFKLEMCPNLKANVHSPSWAKHTSYF